MTPRVVFQSAALLENLALVVGIADTNSGDPVTIASLGLGVFLPFVAALLGLLLRRCAPCPSPPLWGRCRVPSNAASPPLRSSTDTARIHRFHL